jgi:hypothetical protein
MLANKENKCSSEFPPNDPLQEYLARASGSIEAAMSNLNQWLDSFAVRAANGPLHTFTFARGGGFSGREVERLLLDKGIAVFERTRLPGGDLGFSVRADQAEWAEYLLCRAGVPLTCPLLDPANDILLNGDPNEPRSLLDKVVRFVEWC